MNIVEHYASQTQAISQFPIGADNAVPPIWLLGTPVDLDRQVDMISEEWIVGWSLMQMYGRQAPCEDDAGAVIPSRTLPERLASLLLEVSAGRNGSVGNVTFNDLAIALDTHRETVASVLRAFRRQGMVDFGYHRILIQDAASLAELAGEPDIVLV